MRKRAALALAASLAACAAPPPAAPPASVVLAVSVAPMVNPDPGHHAAPVAVRVFFLANEAAFTRAEFFALAEHEQATLGTADLGSQEFIVRPGSTTTMRLTPKPGTAILGVAVAFRDIDHAMWRATAPVAASGPTKLALKLHDLSAVLAPS